VLATHLFAGVPAVVPTNGTGWGVGVEPSAHPLVFGAAKLAQRDTVLVVFANVLKKLKVFFP
jgi:hypothetical protein